MELNGKFRGKVVDNKDPLGRGRIRTHVAAVSELELTWAEPCVPYAGPQVGWFFIPPVGANVWIEFEQGDPNYPIWTGCYWGGGGDPQKIPADATAPDVQDLQTGKIKFILDEKQVRLTVQVETDNGTMKLVMDKSGILLAAAQTTVTITPDKIELKKEPATITVADAITLKKIAASIELADTITLKNVATSAELSSAAVDLKNGASSVSLSPASVSINNGALEVM
jgi:uncharacterized protein involved in type VI secretion and phage assembly